ncbi:HNH endonuclease [Pseudidiomarina sp.]|uniref:HNH endonuclease n=1 Tax=Pseudidiomarina sp. TaxID=2081707 RepID=UPI003A97AB74
MPELNQLLEGLPDNHIQSLEWFWAKRGQRVTWASMKEVAEQGDGYRLSGAAKGIYKPAYSNFTLSVKTMQEGPYPDKDVEYRPDGSWICQYYQEYQNPDDRDKSAGNRGLVLCMEQQIPVGFMIRRQTKPAAEYDVVGLGLVTAWDQGYFTIEGLSDSGVYSVNRPQNDAAKSRTQLSDLTFEDDTPGIYQDNRDFQLRAVALRRGQSAFRNKLLISYNAKCCISGCDIAAALEAAHIAPYLGAHSNIVTNGLLLRSDLHTLFDLGLVAIDQEFRVRLGPELMTSEQYSLFANEKISLPECVADYPDTLALRNHFTWSGFE